MQFYGHGDISVYVFDQFSVPIIYTTFLQRLHYAINLYRIKCFAEVDEGQDQWSIVFDLFFCKAFYAVKVVVSPKVFPKICLFPRLVKFQLSF